MYTVLGELWKLPGLQLFEFGSDVFGNCQLFLKIRRRFVRNARSANARSWWGNLGHLYMFAKWLEFQKFPSPSVLEITETANSQTNLNQIQTIAGLAISRIPPKLYSSCNFKNVLTNSKNLQTLQILQIS